MNTYLEVVNDNGKIIIDDNYFVYSVNHGLEKLKVIDNLGYFDQYIFDGVKPHAFRVWNGYTTIWIPWDIEKELIALELPDGFKINEVEFLHKNGYKWVLYRCWEGSNVTKTMLEKINIFRFTKPIKSPKAWLEIYNNKGDIVFSSESKPMNVLGHILRSLYDERSKEVLFSKTRIGLIITALFSETSGQDGTVSGDDAISEYDSVTCNGGKVITTRESFGTNSINESLTNYCTSILVVDLSNMDD